MTQSQWQAFSVLVNSPNLSFNSKFIDWLWDGTFFCLEGSPSSLEQADGVNPDLEFFAFREMNQYHSGESVPKHEAKETVKRAVAMFKAMNIRAKIAKLTQDGARQVHSEVMKIQDLERRDIIIDLLFDPEYILLDQCREHVMTELNRLYEHFRGLSQSPLSPTV